MDSKCGSNTAYDYTCQVISLGLLYLNFKIAVCEGNGAKVLEFGNIFCLSGKLLVTDITLVRHLLSYHSIT